MGAVARLRRERRELRRTLERVLVAGVAELEAVPDDSPLPAPPPAPAGWAALMPLEELRVTAPTDRLNALAAHRQVAPADLLSLALARGWWRVPPPSLGRDDAPRWDAPTDSLFTASGEPVHAEGPTPGPGWSKG